MQKSHLRTICTPIDEINADVEMLAADLLRIMRFASGIGLSANQIGVLKRIFVVDIDGPLVFINPELCWVSSERRVRMEGCLSLPGVYGNVERPSCIGVRYFDLSGNCCELDAAGLLATCIQHELDHLNGILFIDHLSAVERDGVMGREEIV